MKLIQLEYFCETARRLSITRAAQKLYVTQPAVSSAVKELEKEFSVQLFTHVGNRLALTEEGKAFYEQGEQLLRQVEDTSRKLKDLGKQVPAVRIGIPPLLSTVLFPELLLQLKEECPKVRAELFEYGSARAAELVQKEELDLALVNMDFFEIIEEIWSEVRDEWNPAFIQMECNKLLVKLARYVQNQDYQVKEYISQAKSFMTYHYFEIDSVDDIAAAVGLHKIYLQRIFKKHTGQTIWNYLTDIRLKKAASFLEASDIPIGEIDSMVGIHSRQSFYQNFKKYYHMSPKEYRESARKCKK